MFFSLLLSRDIYKAIQVDQNIFDLTVISRLKWPRVTSLVLYFNYWTFLSDTHEYVHNYFSVWRLSLWLQIPFLSMQLKKFSLLPLSHSQRNYFSSIKWKICSFKEMTGLNVCLQSWWERQWQSQAGGCLTAKRLLWPFFFSFFFLVPNPVCSAKKYFWVNLSLSFLSGLPENVRGWKDKFIGQLAELRRVVDSPSYF